MDFGGGYMPANDVGDGNQGGAGPSPPRRMRDNKTLLPVTVKQLLSAKSGLDDTFKIDNVDLSQVSFVALIRTVNVQATNVTYTLDDGTGVIEAKEWKQQDESEYQQQQRNSRREGVYVRVVGQLRPLKDRRNISVHYMRPLEDHNELTYHFLEAIQAHLYHTRGGATRPSSGAAGATASATHSAGGPAGGAMAMMGGGGSDMNAIPSGLNPTQVRVMQAIRSSTSAEGFHVDEIAQRLNLSVGDVRKAIDYLNDEGHIYSTSDEHHYRAIT